MATTPDSALTLLLNQFSVAEAELKKAHKDLIKAQTRAAEAEMKHRILKDLVASLKGDTEDKSLRQRLLEGIGDEYCTADEILEGLVGDGYQPNPKNPSAAILTTAKRLVEDGLLEENPEPGPKSYRKTQPTNDDELEF